MVGRRRATMVRVAVMRATSSGAVRGRVVAGMGGGHGQAAKWAKNTQNPISGCDQLVE